MNTTGDFYVSWKEDPKGNFRDDVGKRYSVSLITEKEYGYLKEKGDYKKHWAGERFVELAGLVYDP